jgi:putative colanic acid biosynthesis glycosyltransferase WcaI
MDVFVHDFAGHPFQVQLSRELARRGHGVVHAYCPAYASGKGRLEPAPDDPAGFELQPILLGRYDKHSLRRRLGQEIRYGRRLAAQIESHQPDVVISANTPLAAQAIARARCARRGIGFVFWLQDVLGLAIERLSEERLPRPLARIASRPFRLLESHVARRSDAVVAISPAYLPILERWRVRPETVELIENWAPLDDLPPLPRDNAWAREHGLAGKRVLLYSGTLGLKHGSQKLGELALRLSDDPRNRVVVVSEGSAADELRRWASERGLESLLVLPFQPYERLAEVMASADALLALLDERAGELSVPSKVLSYLCAGRPVLAAMPFRNLAAQTIDDAAAGHVVRPGDLDALVWGALRLLSDPALCADLGRNARAYAEEHFDVTRIADRFERVLEAAASPDHAREASRNRLAEPATRVRQGGTA